MIISQGKTDIKCKTLAIIALHLVPIMINYDQHTSTARTGLVYTTYSVASDPFIIKFTDFFL